MKKEPLLKFSKENLQSINFFTEGLEFSVAVATYSGWEEEQLMRLGTNIKKLHMTTEEVCKWCVSHGMKYQIMYPMDIGDVLNNLVKYFKFIKLKLNLQKEMRK